MAGISRYEKIALGLTAAFVLFTGGWFFATQTGAEPYTVTVSNPQGAAYEETDGSAEQSASPQPASSAGGTERPQSLLEGETININTADVYDLERLPGIGEKRAQAIVDYREANGPFQSVEELDHVDGIGEGILSGLRDYVTVETQAPSD